MYCKIAKLKNFETGSYRLYFSVKGDYEKRESISLPYNAPNKSLKRIIWYYDFGGVNRSVACHHMGSWKWTTFRPWTMAGPYRTEY